MAAREGEVAAEAEAGASLATPHGVAAPAPTAGRRGLTGGAASLPSRDLDLPITDESHPTMARMARLSAAGHPHLIVQRGKAGQPVFVDDGDRADYLAALRGAFAIHAYALLDDSVLLLATPRARDDLSRTMQRTSRRYTPAYHRRHAAAGPLWAGRFEATAIDADHHLIDAIRLIEQAPMRAGLAEAPTDWIWSSARHHTGRQPSGLVTEHAAWWRSGNTPFEREARHERDLRQLLGAEQLATYAEATRRGWPLGPPAFIASIASMVDRPVTPRPRGRPPVKR
jgi:putative transposase